MKIAQFMLRHRKYAPKFIFAMTLGAATCFAGCGSGGTTAPSTAEPPQVPLQQQTEQKLDPLTKDDVDLYLKVMRVAAERVKSAVPGDSATLDDARRIIAARGSGRIPTQDDVKTLKRANLVAISMDQIVAEEMKLDARTYRGIAEAIEAVIPNPALGVASKSAVPSNKDHTLTPIEKRLTEVNATNEKLLMPYREGIQKLILIVHDPTNLPK